MEALLKEIRKESNWNPNWKRVIEETIIDIIVIKDVIKSKRGFIHGTHRMMCVPYDLQKRNRRKRLKNIDNLSINFNNWKNV